MPEYWFIEGSRAQALYVEGRLRALHFTGWGEIKATWAIPCGHCGADFEASDTRPRYCSDECRVEGRRAKGRSRVAAHRARRAGS